MIGRTDLTTKTLSPELADRLFTGSALLQVTTPAAQVKLFRKWVEDPEISEVQFNQRQNRLQVEVVKAGKAFRVFEGYFAGITADELVTAIRNGCRDRRAKIQNYFG